MPYILDIATAVPEYSVSKNELVKRILLTLSVKNYGSSVKKHGLRIGTVVFLILTERKLNYLLME